MKTKSIVCLFSITFSFLFACSDPVADEGVGGRSQRPASPASASAAGGATAQGTGGEGSTIATTRSATSASGVSAASNTTTTAGPSSAVSSGGPVECDLDQTAEDVVLGCAEGGCASSWSQLTTCQAACGVFPSASCMLQNCVDEVLAFSQCLSTCPEYIACDPCLLSCINLKNCGFTTLGECYATCPSNADDAVWACGASMLCEVVPMCPELQGL